jgi:hypothetical protein
MRPLDVLGVQFEVEGVERAVDGIGQFSGAVSGLVGSLAFLGDSLADVTKAGNYFYQSFLAIGPRLESMFLMVRGSFQMLGATAEQAGILASKALKQAIAFAEYTPYQQWVVLELQQALARGGLNVFKEFGTLEEVYMETLKRVTGEEKKRIQSALDSLYDWQKQTKVTYLSILADLVAAHGYAGYQLEWVLYHLSRVLETGGTRGLRYLEWWLPQLRRIFKRGEVPKSSEEFVMKVFEHLKKTGQLGASAIASGTIQGLMEGFREMKTSLLQRVIGLPEEGGLFDRFRKVMNKFYDEFRKRLFTAEGELTGLGKAFGDALKGAFTTAINIFERVGIPLITKAMDLAGEAMNRVTAVKVAVQGLALAGVAWKTVGRPAVGFLSEIEPIFRYLVYFRVLGLPFFDKLGSVSKEVWAAFKAGGWSVSAFFVALQKGLQGVLPLLSRALGIFGKWVPIIGFAVLGLQGLAYALERIKMVRKGGEEYLKEPLKPLMKGYVPTWGEFMEMLDEYRKRVEKEEYIKAVLGGEKASWWRKLIGEVSYAAGQIFTFGLIEKHPGYEFLRQEAKERIRLKGLLEPIGKIEEAGSKFESTIMDLAEKQSDVGKKVIEVMQDYGLKYEDIVKRIEEKTLSEKDAEKELKKWKESFLQALASLGGEAQEAGKYLLTIRKNISSCLDSRGKVGLKNTIISWGITWNRVQPALSTASLKAEKLADATDELIRRKYEEARAIREALIAQYMLMEVNLRGREQLLQLLEVMRMGSEELQVIPPRGRETNQTSYNKEININVNMPPVGVSEIKSSIVKTVLAQAREIPDELVRYL